MTTTSPHTVKCIRRAPIFLIIAFSASNALSAVPKAWIAFIENYEGLVSSDFEATLHASDWPIGKLAALPVGSLIKYEPWNRQSPIVRIQEGSHTVENSVDDSEMRLQFITFARSKTISSSESYARAASAGYAGFGVSGGQKESAEKERQSQESGLRFFLEARRVYGKIIIDPKHVSAPQTATLAANSYVRELLLGHQVYIEVKVVFRDDSEWQKLSSATQVSGGMKVSNFGATLDATTQRTFLTVIQSKSAQLSVKARRFGGGKWTDLPEINAASLGNFVKRPTELFKFLGSEQDHKSVLAVTLSQWPVRLPDEYSLSHELNLQDVVFLLEHAKRSLTLAQDLDEIALQDIKGLIDNSITQTRIALQKKSSALAEHATFDAIEVLRTVSRRARNKDLKSLATVKMATRRDENRTRGSGELDHQHKAQTVTFSGKVSPPQEGFAPPRPITSIGLIVSGNSSMVTAAKANANYVLFPSGQKYDELQTFIKDSHLEANWVDSVKVRFETKNISMPKQNFPPSSDDEYRVNVPQLPNVPQRTLDIGRRGSDRNWIRANATVHVEATWDLPTILVLPSL